MIRFGCISCARTTCDLAQNAIWMMIDIITRAVGDSGDNRLWMITNNSPIPQIPWWAFTNIRNLNNFVFLQENELYLCSKSILNKRVDESGVKILHTCFRLRPWTFLDAKNSNASLTPGSAPKSSKIINLHKYDRE